MPTTHLNLVPTGDTGLLAHLVLTEEGVWGWLPILRGACISPPSHPAWPTVLLTHIVLTEEGVWGWLPILRGACVSPPSHTAGQGLEPTPIT